jgi:SET domain-containing protein
MLQFAWNDEFVSSFRENEMIIEYVGEVIRQKMADVREQVISSKNRNENKIVVLLNNSLFCLF